MLVTQGVRPRMLIMPVLSLEREKDRSPSLHVVVLQIYAIY